MTALRLVRVALRDGVEHAYRPRTARTFCGLLAPDPRHGWPRQTRCPVCLSEAERLLHAARDAG